MKQILTGFIVMIFLAGCATVPLGFDQYDDKSCEWIRTEEIIVRGEIIAVRESKEYRNTVIAEVVVWTLLWPFLLASEANMDAEVFQRIDNLKLELKGLERAAKQRNCPKEYDYEIISDKSHSSHLPH